MEPLSHRQVLSGLDLAMGYVQFHHRSQVRWENHSPWSSSYLIFLTYLSMTEMRARLVVGTVNSLCSRPIPIATSKRLHALPNSGLYYLLPPQSGYNKPSSYADLSQWPVQTRPRNRLTVQSSNYASLSANALLSRLIFDPLIV